MLCSYCGRDNTQCQYLHSSERNKQLTICNYCIEYLAEQPLPVQIARHKPPPKVFISYSSKTKQRVEKLATDLRKLGLYVWYDRELSTNGGSRWWERILDQIEQCDVLVFAYSLRALTSPYCMGEYDYAHKLERHILPIQLDNSVSIDMAGDKLFPGIQHLQCVTYIRPSSEELANIYGSLLKLGKGPALPSPMPERPEYVLRQEQELLNEIINENHYSEAVFAPLIQKIRNLHEQSVYPEQSEILIKCVNRVLFYNNLLSGQTRSGLNGLKRDIKEKCDEQKNNLKNLRT